MERGLKFKIRPLTLTTPFLGYFVIIQMGQLLPRYINIASSCHATTICEIRNVQLYPIQIYVPKIKNRPLDPDHPLKNFSFP